MLFWILGAILATAGTQVYIELGLSIPRIPRGDEMVSVPRNGGEKNYVRTLIVVYNQTNALTPAQIEYMYAPRRLLATCLYAVPFICLGNLSGNAIIFGESMLRACNARPSNAGVRGIAIVVSTAACALHMWSRRWGIALNNLFGFVKLMTLLFFAIVGTIAVCNGLGLNSKQVAAENYSHHAGFGRAPDGSFGYASSFLAILFAYGGFNQANYVRGTLSHTLHLSMAC